MHIGVDGKNLTGPLSGISRYIASMIDHIAKADAHITVFAPCELSNWEFDPINVSVVADGCRGRVEKQYWSQFVLPQRVQNTTLDLFWGPAHRLSFIRKSNLPTLLTIHDLVWHEYPETMAFGGYWGERLLMPRSIVHADKIITPSNYTRSRLNDLYPASADKTETIYPGPTSKIVQPPKKTAQTPFVLFVGTLEPRKNLIRLVKAYSKLPRYLRQRFHMKIVGATGWKLTEMDKQLVATDAADTIDILGFVSDEELEQLYHDCEFLVLPSLSEGFGLPIIEAQKYAKPVLTSNCSALPEVAKDGALYIDPLDVDSIKDGLQKLMTDNELRANLSMGALQNVERFSWAKAAEQFLEIAYSMQGPAGQHAKGSAFLQNA